MHHLLVCNTPTKGVFKGGGEVRRFKPFPKIFLFFLKSAGKEVERKINKRGGGGVNC